MIDDHMIHSILEYELAVADMTTLNANVFYELGMIHTLGKDSLLIKRQDTKLSADFAGAL